MEPIRYNHLLNYLQSGEYPNDFSKDDKQKLRRRASNFHLDDAQVLYNKNETSLHRVVQQAEKTNVIIHVHNGIGGAHFGESNTINL